MIIKIVVILNNSADNADVWPYDLDYVAVQIPPQSWSIGQDAAWFLLQALNNGLSNVSAQHGREAEAMLNNDPDYTYTVPHSVVSFSSRSAAHHLHPW
jgi:hypothetical protein